MSSTGFKITQASGGSWVNQTALSTSGWGNNNAQTGIFVNGKYIIVGANCRIAESTDGVTWRDMPGLRNQYPQFATTTLRGIIWDGTYYMVSGALFAWYAFSTDLVNWNFFAPSSYSGNGQSVDLAYNGSVYVMNIANYGSISTTTPYTGAQWTYTTQHGLGNQGTNIRVIYDSTSAKFIIYATSTGIYSTSTDGANWTASLGLVNVGFSNVAKIYYDGTQYVATSATGGLTATSADLVTWTAKYTNFLPMATPLDTRMTYANGKTLAVAGGWTTQSTDYSLSSDSGSTWTRYTLPLAGAPNDLIYTTQFVLSYSLNGPFGTTNFVYTSADCITWTQRTGIVGGYGSAPLAFNGSNVILTYRSSTSNLGHSTLNLSTDGGTTWTQKVLPATTGWGCNAYGGGKFVVLPTSTGGGGTPGTVGAYSTDNGATWSSSTLPVSVSWGKCIYANSIFFVVPESGSTAMRSSDGITWTTVTLPVSTNWPTLLHDGTQFVIIGTNGAGYYSTNNGTSWTAITMPGTYSWGASAWTGTKYLIPVSASPRYTTGTSLSSLSTIDGNNPFFTTTIRDALYYSNTYYTFGDSGKYASSSNLVSWTAQTGISNTAYGTNAITVVLKSTSNNFIATGTTTNVVSSNNLSTWTYQTGLASTGWGAETIVKIVYNGSVWVAVGNAGKVATSTDKIFWTFQPSLRNTTWGTDNINDINWNGTQFLVTGPNGKIATSPDGATWTYRGGLSSTTWGTTSVNCVAYGNGTYVVGGGGVGALAITATSTDGITWTYSSAINSGFGNRGLFVLSFGNGVFCAAGQYAACATSPDGITWTNRTSLSGLLGLTDIRNLIWGNNEFVATASFGARVCSSPDGNIWTERTTITQYASRQLFGLLYYKRNYYAYGAEGRIVRSPDLITWTNVNGPGVTGSLIPTSFDIRTIEFNDSDDTNQLVIGGTSTTMYVGAFENYRVDVDDVLVRREYFSDGSLWYWNNTTMSPVTAAGSGLTWKVITDFSTTSGASARFGIKTDGTLWSFSNYASPPSQVIYAGYANNDWKSIACGYQHPGAQLSVMSIKTDGTLWAWGGNAYGQLGVGDSTNKSSPVSVVGGHTWKSVAMVNRAETIGNSLAIRTDNTLWYMNVSPVQVATGGTWKQIAVNESISGIKTDGTLWTWGGTSSPTTIAGSGGYKWKSISCGYRCTWVIREDGTLWGIGNNTGGQLGITGGNAATLTQLTGGGTNWKKVFTGMAIKTDGTLWAWGSTPGDGTSVTKSSPVLVAGGITNWEKSSVGVYGVARVVITDNTL